MDYKKIIEDYQEIQKSQKNCESLHEEDYIQLTKDIKASLQDKSFQEYSQYFSDLFDIWLLANQEPASLYLTSFNEKLLDKKYIAYKKQTLSFSLSDQDLYPIAASKEYPMLEIVDYLEQKRKDRVQELLNFSTLSQTDKLHETTRIIEYSLNELWLYIFNQKLAFLSFKDDSNDNLHTKKHLKIDEYFHQNWPLYELINQISKTIDQVTKEGKSQKIKISSLKSYEKDEIIENTDAMCKHILETCILDPEQNRNDSPIWFPKLEIYKDIRLPHIIATSDLVSYIFEYKLMPAKKKNDHLKKVKKSVGNIYNNLINGNVLYDAIESYINENDKEDLIVKYKNHLLCPRTIFIFVTSVIQEVVRKALTQSRSNIFYLINQNSRDKGLTEEFIMSKIKKDTKAYMLIFHYFDKPVSATINKKEEQLNGWIQELNKLRYGVLDDYLFTLAETAGISFKEENITTINTKKK